MKVLILTDDLLFGSRLQAMLSAHEVELASEPRSNCDVIVADLTVDAEGRLASLRRLEPRPATLAFYAHVDTDVRERAKAAGIEIVVPRSRIAREASELVKRAAG